MVLAGKMRYTILIFFYKAQSKTKCHNLAYKFHNNVVRNGVAVDEVQEPITATPHLSLYKTK